MSRLELRVPPDVVWVVVAGLMWLVARGTPRLVLPSALRVGIGALLAVCGVAVIVSARAALRRAETTWRPMSPGETTSLVTTGAYAFSRNPIYVGMMLVILGWAALLGSPGALLVSSAFVLYIDRYQIAPEEQALSASIGHEYLDYQARVRRWI